MVNISCLQVNPIIMNTGTIRSLWMQMNEEKHWKMPDWIRMNMISKEGAFTMAKVFITLTGTKHYFGNDFLKKGTKIRLEKEPDNEYDKEAIKVTYEGLGKIGDVANSSYTVIGESMSAGRLYDKIGDVAYAKVILVTPAGTICKICKKSLVKDEEL